MCRAQVGEGESDVPVGELTAFLAGRKTVALSGAGMSTDSGIPDYRGPNGSLRFRQPMQYREFVGSDAARRRYWARSYLGWDRIRAAGPNPGHLALARIEKTGSLVGLITQNVDRMHQAAGSVRVLELHGSLAEVLCLDCSEREARDHLQDRLRELNPEWQPGLVTFAPDGDAELARESESSFEVSSCLRCGGTLKPDVVFFGESVPRERVEAAWSLFSEGEQLLVVGSSLTVFSGFRFVERAVRLGMPVAIVNRGPTRGDRDATVRVEGSLSDVLPAVAEALAAR